MCSITVTVAKINRILCSILLMLGKLCLKYYTQELEITMLVFFCLFVCLFFFLIFACLLVFLFVYLFVCSFACVVSTWVESLKLTYFKEDLTP